MPMPCPGMRECGVLGVLGSDRFLTLSGDVSATEPSCVGIRACGGGRRNAAAEIVRGPLATDGVDPVPPERLYMELAPGGGAIGVLIGVRYGVPLASMEGDGEVRGPGTVTEGRLPLLSLAVGEAGVEVGCSGLLERASGFIERSRSRT